MFQLIYRIDHSQELLILSQKMVFTGSEHQKNVDYDFENKITASASFLADISVRSPQKLFIVIIEKTSFLDQSIQKTCYLILKTEALHTASISVILCTRCFCFRN